MAITKRCVACESNDIPSDTVANNDKLSCALCSGSYHYKCAALTKSAYKLIVDNDCVFWKCPSCNTDSFKLILTKIEAMSALLKEHDSLLVKITGNLNTEDKNCVDKSINNDKPVKPQANSGLQQHEFAQAAAIMKPGASRQTSRPPTRHVSTTETPKPSQSNDENLNLNMTTGRAAPLAPVEISDVTKLASESSTETNTGENNQQMVTLRAAELRRWVHLRNFHPEVTKEEVLAYANQVFKVDDIRCIQLVKGQDYASFRVGVKASLYDNTIGNPSAWPKDIAVREFLPMEDFRKHPRQQRQRS